MPGHGTPKITLRVSRADWDAFGAAAEAAGLERTVLLRAFMAWFARQPGAKLPRRP